jgi:hypothetical protein
VSEHDYYRDYLRPRGLTFMKATLRVVVAVQCLGAAALRLSLKRSSPLSLFFQENLGWTEAQSAQFDDGAAIALLVIGLLTALRPAWPVLLPVVVWFASISLVPLVQGVNTVAVLEPIEHASRILAPLALLVLDFWPPRLRSHLGRTIVSMWLLRLAAALTFAGHGVVALLHSLERGHFLELLLSGWGAVIQTELDEPSARQLLAVIGGIDLGLAMNVLFARSRPVLAYMALWGFATAAVRMVHFGPEAYPESLLRIANGGVPVVVLLYVSLALKETKPEIIPGN